MERRRYMRGMALVLAATALALVLASGVAWAFNEVGTNGPDTLRGTNGDDNLSGRGGQDDIFGFGGGDALLGGAGKDWVLGGGERRPGGGDKNLAGGSGNDGVITGRGSDTASGGEGNDLMIDGNLRESSHDNFSGNAGNDVLVVNHVPPFEDVASCGGGFDRVLADTKDVVAPDCERVRVVRGSGAEVTQQEQAFFESIPESFFRGLAPFPE
jgi:Ca2+-binding RTX toxin-like protein